MGFSRNRNWCLLQNRPLQYRLFQCRLHQIVQYRWNPLFWGLLGLIRKRLVEFRLDFLAFIRIDQILTSPSLVDIPPVFVFVQSLRQALLILVLWLQKMATECFFGSHSNFLCRLGHVLYAVRSCNG